MRGSASSLFASVLLAQLWSSIFVAQAQAAQCSDIYPDARVGPPPEWTFWGDGSACFVRWDAQKGSETALLEQCQKTPNARFVHFEPDNGEGRSICIFKLLGADLPSQEQALNSASDTPPWRDPELAQDQQSTQYRKSDAENPSLNELKDLVTKTTEKCVSEEKAGHLETAQSCWRHAAAEMERFSADQEFLAGEFHSQIVQLRKAWLQRSEQLKAPVVRVTQRDESTVLPAATHLAGPDPDRLTETAICSSTSLGNFKECLRDPTSTGANRYAFRIKSSCKAGVIAAVKTYDESGRCIRKVVAVLPHQRSRNVISTRAPEILDAISFQGSETFECYVRRHEQISCDGKIDYGVSASNDTGSSGVKIKQKKKNQVASKKPTKKKRLSEPQQEEAQIEEKPSFLAKVSNSLKDLFKSQD